MCWRGNDVNTGLQYPRRTIEKALGEAPLYSGRNVLMGDPNMRTSLHTQLRGGFVEMLEIFQVHLTGENVRRTIFQVDCCGGNIMATLNSFDSGQS